MNSSNTEIPSLDGLRGLACLMVVYFHAGVSGWVPIVIGLGDIGVMLFFSLSGFLMGYIYLPDTYSTRYWLAFYIRRYFRLYPVFIIATLGVFIFGHRAIFNMPTNFHQLIDIWLLHGRINIFWTISAELKFYAIYPLIAIFFMHQPTNRWYYLPVVSMLVIVIAYLVLASLHQEKLFKSSMFFFGGIIAAASLKHYQLSIESRGRIWNVIAIGCLCSVFSIIYLQINHLNIYNDFWYISPLLALCVVSVALSSGIIRWFFTNPPIRFIGKTSYSMYLTHVFVQFPVQLLPRILHNVWIMFTLVVILSTVFYYIIERPFHLFSKNAARIMIEPREVL